jgi:methionine-rich copper-binding protein CopC
MRLATVTVPRWILRGALIIASFVACLAVPAAPAYAHGQLAMSNPVADSTVSALMPRLELYFTERVASYAYFTLTAPSGIRVDAGWEYGESKQLDKPVQEYFLVEGKWEPKMYHTGFAALVKVSHWPEKGAYALAYQSVASDGEAVKGTLRFTYAGATAAAPPGWTAPTDGPPPALTAALANPHGQSAPGAAPQQQPAAAPPPQEGDTGQTSLWTWLIPFVLIVVVAIAVLTAGRSKPAPAPAHIGARTKKRKPVKKRQRRRS